MRVDRATMAYGIEARVPLLDRDVVRTVQPEVVASTLAPTRTDQIRHFYQTWALYVLSLRFRRWVENEK